MTPLARTFPIFLISLLSITVEAEEKTRPGLGMWSWHQSAFATTEARQDMLAFCDRGGISHIDQHVSLQKMGSTYVLQNADAFASLIAEAGKRGISINALRGDPAMFFESNHEAALSQLVALVEFDRQLPGGARLAGVKYDVEPYLTPEWKTGGESRLQVMRDYLAVLQRIRKTLDAEAPHLVLGADVPFWWDKPELEVTFDGRTQVLVHHVQDLTDWIGIMSYRRESADVLRFVATELAYAGTKSKERSVAAGLDTIEIKGEESHITFWGTPPATFRKTLTEVREGLAGNPSARLIMLHDYTSLVKYLK